MPRETAYRLGGYKITESSGGGLWWTSHSGLAAEAGGPCFIQGDILVIGPRETEKSGFLKTEFMESLAKLPPWDKTRYYCLFQSLRLCKSVGTRTLRPKKSGNMRTHAETPTKAVSREPISCEYRMNEKQNKILYMVDHVKEWIHKWVQKKFPGS